jgi:hypothetical protein
MILLAGLVSPLSRSRVAQADTGMMITVTGTVIMAQ